jgi:hypothetical protein
MSYQNRHHSNAIEFLGFKKAVVLVVYANPKTKRSDIARLAGITPKELSRLLNLKGGKGLLDLAKKTGPPSTFTNHQITAHSPIPYALDVQLKELAKEAKRADD